MAVDSQGNLYVAETNFGRRVQRFRIAVQNSSAEGCARWCNLPYQIPYQTMIVPGDCGFQLCRRHIPRSNTYVSQ